jgi:hypothetical protein
MHGQWVATHVTPVVNKTIILFYSVRLVGSSVKTNVRFLVW